MNCDGNERSVVREGKGEGERLLTLVSGATVENICVLTSVPVQPLGVV